MLPVDTDVASDSDATHQPANAVAQLVGAHERLLDEARLARGRGNVAHHGPFRPLDGMLAVPLRIFGDRDAALVRRDRAGAAHGGLFLIGLGRDIVACARLLLLDPHRVGWKLDGFARWRRALAKIPKTETIVAVDGLDDIGLDVELQAHLAEIIAKQHPDLAADRGIGEA